MLPNLYFPIEIGMRELTARLLTACAAVERGFRIVLGYQHDLFATAPNLPPGILFSKGTNNIFINRARQLREFGHAFMACEEELFGFCLDLSPLTYNAERLSEVCDLYLCMGRDEADYMTRRYGSKLPTTITGNARTDVLRPNVKGMYSPEANSIRRKYGKFILLNPNFGLINPANRFSIDQWFDI